MSWSLDGKAPNCASRAILSLPGDWSLAIVRLSSDDLPTLPPIPCWADPDSDEGCLSTVTPPCSPIDPDLVVGIGTKTVPGDCCPIPRFSTNDMRRISLGRENVSTAIKLDNSYQLDPSM